MPINPIDQALLLLLCRSAPAQHESVLQRMIPKAGLFAQINGHLNNLLWAVLQGNGAGGMREFYAMPLNRYGRETFGEHLQPALPCPETDTSASELTWATRTLQDAPRYLVASHLMRLVVKPRQQLLEPAPSALAMHIRRGDKLTAVGRERITLLQEGQLAHEALRSLRELTHVNSTRERLMPVDWVPPHAGRVLIATDNEAFGAAVAHRLRRLEPRLTPRNAMPNYSRPFSINLEYPYRMPRSGGLFPEHWEDCSSACVAPLLWMAEQFLHASSLIFSSRSNVGVYILTAWGAANSDTIPHFRDMDGRVHPADLLDGHVYFCHLGWGALSGLCTSKERFSHNQTCLPQHTARSPQIAECCSGSEAEVALGCRACTRRPPVCSNKLDPHNR